MKTGKKQMVLMRTAMTIWTRPGALLWLPLLLNRRCR